MKHSTLYRFTTLVLGVFSYVYTFAVAPLPGLDLKEPHRPVVKQGYADCKRAARAAASSRQHTELAQRGLLIIVEFTDQSLSAENTIQAFDSLANGDNYTYNGATGSCKQYFQAQSNGQYIPHFDIIGPVVLPHEVGYYGADADYAGDDRYPADLVIDACAGADAMGADFSIYDQDNDGAVDQVYIIYAGYSQAEGAPENTIWPHAWDLQSSLAYGYTNQTTYYVNINDQGYITSQNLPKFDGKTIISYACSNEQRFRTNQRNGIGTICHEFSHVLGLPDYYLTTQNPVVNERYTPGSWSLMSHGNYLNNGNTPPNYSVYDKYYLGWLEPTVLDHSQSLTIPADGTTTYMLARNEQHVADGAHRTDTVYYIENRQQEGWDAYLPGHGMLVWRVIYDDTDWYNNSPNDYVARYLLVSAHAMSSPYTEYKPKQEVPFPGSKNVTKYEPFKGLNGLYNIQETNGIITCDFTTTNTPSALETPVADEIRLEGTWYNILGQPIDIWNYKGVAVNTQGQIIIR